MTVQQLQISLGPPSRGLFAVRRNDQQMHRSGPRTRSGHQHLPIGQRVCWHAPRTARGNTTLVGIEGTIKQRRTESWSNVVRFVVVSSGRAIYRWLFCALDHKLMLGRFELCLRLWVHMIWNVCEQGSLHCGKVGSHCRDLKSCCDMTRKLFEK